MRKSKQYYEQFTKQFLTKHIVELNKSINHICKEFGVTKDYIRTKCREFNISTTQHALISKNASKEELLDLHFNQKKTKKQIAEQFNASKRTVSQWFRKFGITGTDNRKEQNKISRYNTLTKDVLISEYCHRGLLKHEIQKKYNIGQEALDKLFSEYQIDLIHSRNKSLGEKDLCDWISTITKDEIIRKTRDIISPLEIDIYIPSKKLAIEFDGTYWHSTRTLKKDYHIEKTNLCEAKGITLLHVYDIEWQEKKEIWKSIIRSKLGLVTKIYARKCVVREVDSKTARQFCEQNHLSGYANSKTNIGLYYNENLVSLMTFAVPRFNKKHRCEIIRFCTLLNHQVVGGASKIFKYFTTENSIDSIITYANRRYSQGNLYTRLGFREISQTAPNYFYLFGKKLLSRMIFQKHKLKDRLSIFDSSLTEEQNMEANGYYRVYDCGNISFIWLKTN